MYIYVYTIHLQKEKQRALSESIARRRLASQLANNYTNELGYTTKNVRGGTEWGCMRACVIVPAAVSLSVVCGCILNASPAPVAHPDALRRALFGLILCLLQHLHARVIAWNRF